MTVIEHRIVQSINITPGVEIVARITQKITLSSRRWLKSIAMIELTSLTTA